MYQTSDLYVEGCKHQVLTIDFREFKLPTVCVDISVLVLVFLAIMCTSVIRVNKMQFKKLPEANRSECDCASTRMENVMDLSQRFKKQVIRALYFNGEVHLLT